MTNLNEYKIEYRILTLVNCAVIEEGNKPASFDIDGVKFSHWDFNYSDGWVTNAWLATITLKTKNNQEALSKFIKKLSRLIPRIALISQAYVEYLSEPYLIHEIGNNIASFRYTKDVGATGLMFMDDERKALVKLLKDKKIPEAFYYYWNDAVNTTGYSAKLLLMFSAIEALAKKNGEKD